MLGLVNERRGVERVAWALVRQMAGRQLARLNIH
jgi:hypothetical protein